MYCCYESANKPSIQRYDFILVRQYVPQCFKKIDNKGAEDVEFEEVK